MKENRFIAIEVEALKQQLRDISQVIERSFKYLYKKIIFLEMKFKDRATLLSNRPDLEAVRQNKGQNDEENKERIASLLQEIQLFRDEIRSNNSEKEQVGFHFSYIFNSLSFDVNYFF